MVADDSVVARVVARRALKSAPNVQVVAAVADGQSAINRLPTARPDVLISRHRDADQIWPGSPA